ncbi:MAG TPA: superoxide dismutase [Bacteroidia bacterium]
METSPDRRAFIKKSAIVTLGALAVSKIPAAVKHGLLKLDDGPQFKLPPLGYDYNALEPWIDAQTMEIHYSKHHQAYVDKLNKALGEAKVNGVSLDDLVKNISKYSTAVRNNAGGHWNHSFFWKLMEKTESVMERLKLHEAINNEFGSAQTFQEKFNDAAKSVFGSGWAWVVVNKDKKLEIGITHNQDNPLMDVSEFKGVPVIGIDVWEHAYYLKHQNVRADYIKDWWNTVNWETANTWYEAALK